MFNGSLLDVDCVLPLNWVFISDRLTLNFSKRTPGCREISQWVEPNKLKKWSHLVRNSPSACPLLLMKKSSWTLASSGISSSPYSRSAISCWAETYSVPMPTSSDISADSTPLRGQCTGRSRVLFTPRSDQKWKQSW